MYPLLLMPAFKNYVWGGSSLCQLYGIEKQIIAESWVLSDREDGDCTVMNGKYKGMPLSAVLKELGFQRLPHIVKLIDAKEKLSIQVHPDDAFALKHEGCIGKNEVWYIINNEENAKIYCGVKNGYDKDSIIEASKNGTLEDALVSHRVKKGDAFKISCGCPHAIGNGVFLAEVQDSSDITYRLYDHGRNTRPLHLEKAEKVLRTDTDSGKLELCGVPTPQGSVTALWERDGFSAYVSRFDGASEIRSNKLLSLTVLEGMLELNCTSEKLSVSTGCTALIFPDTKAELSGTCQLLITNF